MQKVLLLLWALVVSCTSVCVSQSSSSSWSQLSVLKAGQAVQVIDTASKKHTGTFVSASDTAMTIEETSREESVQRQDVRSVKVVRSNQHLKHAVIGAAAGAGAGGAIGAASGSSGGFFGSDRGALAGVGAGIGAIVGAIVGAILPAHGTTIYEAGAH